MEFQMDKVLDGTGRILVHLRVNLWVLQCGFNLQMIWVSMSLWADANNTLIRMVL